MKSDDPPFLLVGTEVSAKFKGAFCEAKVKKIVKSVRCKVLLKEAPFGSVTVEDTNIRGKLELNQLVEITQGKVIHKGIIQYIKDCSTYTVVFNDGDERVLRRTQVCLKGAKHFDAAGNLDSMPLYHPESFASSISCRDMRKRILKRKALTSNLSDEDDADEEDDEEEDDDRCSSRRSSSIFKSSPPTKSSTPSLRSSVRRSASVTPLKGANASTRAATRAIIALRNSRLDDESLAASKSPTPSSRSIQPSPLPMRASSVMVSARHVGRKAVKSLSPSSGSCSDTELRNTNKSSRRGSSRMSSNRNRNANEKGLDDASCSTGSLNASRESLQNAASSSATASTISNNCGSSGNFTAASGRRKLTTVEQNGSNSNTVAGSSSSIGSASIVLAKSSTLSSTSRLMTTTISSREKMTKQPTDKDAATTNAVPHPKKRKLNSKREQPSTLSSDTKSKSNDIDDGEENVIDSKNFPVGSVVVINESNSTTKIEGGRIRLGMVVALKEYKTNALNNNKISQIIGKRQIPVRSFQNGRYHAPYVDCLSTFNPSEFRKLTDTSLPCLKIAFERANLYYTKKELPQSWEKRPSVSSELSTKKDKGKEKDRDKEKSKAKERKKTVDSSTDNEKEDDDNDQTSSASSSSTSDEDEKDEDYNERRDRFVAHFYKFQDESGNPMNRVPVLGGREIDLYRFYDLVNRMGGHKRVTSEARWRRVLTKLRLEDCSGATPQTVKNAYLRYFEKFESFMKHLGYSSLNGSASSSTFSRSSRTIRTSHDVDWKKSAEKRKEKRVKEKNETGGFKRQRVSSKDSSVDASSLPKISRLSTLSFNEKASSSVDKPSTSADALSNNNDGKSLTVGKPEKPYTKMESVDDSLAKNSNNNGSNKREATEVESAVNKQANLPQLHYEFKQKASALKPSSSSFAMMMGTTDKKSSSVKVELPTSNEHPRKLSKHFTSPSLITSSSSSSTAGDVKLPKIKREHRDSENSGKSVAISRTKSTDSVPSSMGITSSKKQKQRAKSPGVKRKHGLEMGAVTSSDEDTRKHFQKQRRRGSSGKEGRVKSPLGHQAVEEQDVGYFNANIFTRFYQGQKVHARHHLRFYDARIVIVKQPSLTEISKSLVNAFELGRITHASSTCDLDALDLRNMGAELKDALKNMVNATKCFVHYLGWNSRYDEWLMLHKIRVEEKDDKASTKALESLIPNELPPQLFAVAMDWCISPEGIPALAFTHAYASDQQRPRRLSSSTTSGRVSGGIATKLHGVNPNVSGSNATVSTVTSSMALPLSSISSTSNSAGSTNTEQMLGSLSSITASSAVSRTCGGFHPYSKFAVSHSSVNVLGIKPASASIGTGGKLLSSGNVSSGNALSSVSNAFAYQSPLSASSRSPSSGSSASIAVTNPLSISTSSLQQQVGSANKADSGHSSPLSPVYQHQRALSYHQHQLHQNSLSLKQSAFDEASIISRQKSSTESSGTSKFTIPHLQQSQRFAQNLVRTTSSSSVDKLSPYANNRTDLGTIPENFSTYSLNVLSSFAVAADGDQSINTLDTSTSKYDAFGSILSPPASIAAIPTSFVSSSMQTTTSVPSSTIIFANTPSSNGGRGETINFSSDYLEANVKSKFSDFSSVVFSAAAPIGVNRYQESLSNTPAEPPLTAQHHMKSSEALLLPSSLSIPASLLMLSTSGHKISSVEPSFNREAVASTFPTTANSVLPRFETLAVNSVSTLSGENTDATDKTLFVTLTKREETINNFAVYTSANSFVASYVIKNDGTCVEEQSSSAAVVKDEDLNLASKQQLLVSLTDRIVGCGKEEACMVVKSSFPSAINAGGDTSSSMYLLPPSFSSGMAATLSGAGGRTSPLTTISSCGAVEDFDENSSLRHTETPNFNDDDECASIASNDAKSTSSLSKMLLHSPAAIRRTQRGASVRGRLSRQHSKSPCLFVTSQQTDPLTTSAAATVLRTSTPRSLRRHVPLSKSPETSGTEDNYEEQTTHTDSSHAVRLRVQQRMETEHLFASYSFIGLPELEDLVEESDSCEKSIKIIEDRMQALRDIYQTFRGKLTRLERRHKKAMMKKKQLGRDLKERNVSTTAVADNNSELNSSFASNNCGSGMDICEGGTAAELSTGSTNFDMKNQLEPISA